MDIIDTKFIEEIDDRGSYGLLCTFKNIENEDVIIKNKINLTEYLKIRHTDMNKNDFSFYSFFHSDEVKTPFSYLVPMYGQVGWPTGIIIHVDNAKYLNEADIEIKIGYKYVCKINIGFLLKFFCKIIKNNRIFIEIPKQYAIIEPIDQKIIGAKLNPFTTDKKYMHGIPLFHLIYNEVRLEIRNYDKIDCKIIYEYTSSNYLDEARRKMQYDIMYGNIYNEYFTMDLASCQKIKYDDLNELKYTHNIDINNLDTSYVCMKCFSKLLQTKKNIPLSLYHIIKLDKMYQLGIFPKSLNELIISYESFDPCHIIIVYEDNDNSLEYYKIYCNRFKFIEGCCSSNK